MANEDLIKPAIEDIPQDIQINEKGNLQQLVFSAKKFITDVETIVNEQQHIYKITNLNTIDLNSISQAMQNNRNKLHSLLDYQAIFQRHLNEYLGRSIHMVWVADDGTLFFVHESQISEIYNLATKSHGRARGNISGGKTLLKKLGTLSPQIDQNLSKMLNDRYNKYSRVFHLAQQSWQMNHTKVKDKNRQYWYTYYKNTLWWVDETEARGYGHSAKINKGHIKEAYVSLIMGDEHDAPVITDSDEEIIKNYWIYMQSHNILNNRAGIVQGDVILRQDNGDDSVQFAVKSGNFSTAAIGPYLQMAISIIGLDYQHDLTQGSVKELLKDTSSYVKNLTQKGKQQLQEYINTKIKITNVKIQ